MSVSLEVAYTQELPGNTGSCCIALTSSDAHHILAKNICCFFDKFWTLGGRHMSSMKQCSVFLLSLPWPLYLSTGWNSFPETFIKTPAGLRGIENVPLSVWNIFFMVNYPFKHKTFIWPGFGKWCRQTGHQLQASWKWKSPVELQSTIFSILQFKIVVNSFILPVITGPLKKKKKNLMDSLKEPGI